MEAVESYLQSKGIPFTLHQHEAVHTASELTALQLPGLPVRNLFLRDQKKRRHLIFSLPADMPADLAVLAQAVGEKKFSFVNPETMALMLGLAPGAVSPFGLLNDLDRKVELVVHRKVMEAPLLQFHPNRSTATMVMSPASLLAFLDSVGRKAMVIDF